MSHYRLGTVQVLDSDPADVPHSHSHEMEAIKQLACAVIHRAIDDAQGIGVKVNDKDQVEAKQFLLNTDGMLSPWAELAGVDAEAIVEYALRRGYEVRTPTALPPVSKVAGAVAEALPIRRAPKPPAQERPTPMNGALLCPGCQRPKVCISGLYLCINMRCNYVEMRVQ